MNLFCQHCAMKKHFFHPFHLLIGDPSGLSNDWMVGGSSPAPSSSVIVSLGNTLTMRGLCTAFGNSADRLPFTSKSCILCSNVLSTVCYSKTATIKQGSRIVRLVDLNLPLSVSASDCPSKESSPSKAEVLPIQWALVQYTYSICIVLVFLALFLHCY